MPILIFSTFISYSQSFDQVIFGGRENDIGYACFPAVDGYILAGSTESFGNGGEDICLIRVDESLNPLWTKSIGGTDRDFARSIIQTSDDGFLVIGSTYSSGGGNKDFIACKFSDDGNLEWSKTYGSFDQERGFCGIQTPDGGYVIGGTTTSYQTGLTGLLIKTDPDGNVEWSKNYYQYSTVDIFSITLHDDYLIISGPIFNPEFNFMIGVLDLDGNPQWFQCYSGALEDHNRRVLVTKENRIVFVGHTLSAGTGQMDVCLTGLDMNGNLIFSKVFGTSLSEYSGSLLELNDGFLISSHSNAFLPGGDRKILLIKTDLSGNLIWSRTYGGSLSGHVSFGNNSSICNANQGGFLLTGHVNSENGNGSEILCAKIDEEGLTICDDEPVVLNQNSFNPSVFPVYLEVDDVSVFSSDFPWQPQEISFDRKSLCLQVPIAGFTSDLIEICQYESVNFADLSINEPHSWEWRFEGGTPDKSLLQDPQNIQYNNSGIFDVFLKVTNSTGSDSILYEDYLTVFEAPSLNLGPDTVLCSDESILLRPEKDFVSYLWHDGSTGPEFLVDRTGKYSLLVWDGNGCQAEDSVFIAYAEIPRVLLGNDTVLTTGETLILDAGEGMEEYLWHDGTTNRYFEVFEDGIYWVRVKNEYCYNYDTIVIDYECEASLIIPNCFTPNGDGINESFNVVYENIKDYKIVIFNRWGQLLFESGNLNEGWDGRYNQQMCPQGTYFYLINFKTDCGSGIERFGERKGSVTLLK